MTSRGVAEPSSQVVHRRTRKGTTSSKAANHASPLAFDHISEDLSKLVKGTYAVRCDDDISTTASSTPSRLTSLESYAEDEEDNAPWSETVPKEDSTDGTSWRGAQTPPSEVGSYCSSRSATPSRDSHGNGDDKPWQRARTPSPEVTYSFITGRSLPPPNLLMLPAGAVVSATPPLTSMVSSPTGAQDAAADTTPVAHPVRAASTPTRSQQAAKAAVELADRVVREAPPSAKLAAARTDVQLVLMPVEDKPQPKPTLGRKVSWADYIDEDDADCFGWLQSQEDPARPTAGDEDLTLSSVGAAGHNAGTCRPCAHIWRPTGCSKGHDCTYCHSCGREEWFQYKRMYKLQRMYQEQQEKPAAGSRRARRKVHHWMRA